jgi:site-specific DNA-cytosine methylase
MTCGDLFAGIGGMSLGLTVESPVGRRAHGVSARLARARWRAELKALGNAVVPQVVEVIGRAILAVETAHE